MTKEENFTLGYKVDPVQVAFITKVKQCDFCKIPGAGGFTTKIKKSNGSEDADSLPSMFGFSTDSPGIEICINCIGKMHQFLIGTRKLFKKGKLVVEKPNE